MDAPPEHLAAIVGIVRHINSVNVVSSTILVFDWLLTLNLEYSYIWKAKWNITTILYLLTRYLPFIDTSLVLYHQLGFGIPESTCKKIIQTVAFMFLLGATLAETIFTLRTWAVWSKSKIFTWCLFSAFISVWSAIWIVGGFYVKSLTHKASPVPGFIGCIFTPSSPILSVVYILFMAYDACLVILMTVRGIVAFKMGGDSHLARVVYRDGIIYYIYVFLLSLLNVVVIFKLPISYENLLLMLERVVHSVLVCRAVLHIRQQVVEDSMIAWEGPTPRARYESTEME